VNSFRSKARRGFAPLCFPGRDISAHFFFLDTNNHNPAIVHYPAQVLQLRVIMSTTSSHPTWVDTRTVPPPKSIRGMSSRANAPFSS